MKWKLDSEEKLVTFFSADFDEKKLFQSMADQMNFGDYVSICIYHGGSESAVGFEGSVTRKLGRDIEFKLDDNDSRALVTLLGSELSFLNYYGSEDNEKDGVKTLVFQIS